MSQNLIVQTKPKAPTALFSMNMQNVTDLFPGFAPGDFAVIHGSQSFTSLTSLLCIRAQLPAQLGGLNSNVIFIDGGNTYKPTHIARLAQTHHLDPDQTLNRISVQKAFTAYQMTMLIMERLKETVQRFNAKLVVISDIAGLFLDEDSPDEEARGVFSQILAYLQNFARENNIIVLATYLSRPSSSRNLCLRTLTCVRANVVIGLRLTKYERDFELEKHPRFMLCTAEFPSDNLTLTDFM
jgi:hypothetical protein